MTHVQRLAVLVLQTVFLSAALYGQAVTGSLVGTVTDASGGAVSAAKVVIAEIGTGVSRSTETNASGLYVFADLEAGDYRVEVERAGFSKAVRARVDVLVNSTVRADIALQLGGVTQTIDVTSDVGALQTDRADTEIGRASCRERV